VGIVMQVAVAVAAEFRRWLIKKGLRDVEIEGEGKRMDFVWN
jgi:hypothetical protein